LNSEIEESPVRSIDLDISMQASNGENLGTASFSTNEHTGDSSDQDAFN